MSRRLICAFFRAKLIMRPVRKSWLDLVNVEKADDDFVIERSAVIEEGVMDNQRLLERAQLFEGECAFGRGM